MSLITRIITFPFALLSLVVSRLLRLRAARLLLDTSSNSDDDDDDFEGIKGHIVDPKASARHFARSVQRQSDGSRSEHDNPWLLESYTSAVRLAKEELKILMIVLTSSEHDDNRAFMRNTLGTAAFGNLLHEHRDNLLLWGGNVCKSRDAHITQTILQATTYPFVAFLSLQPLAPSRLAPSASTPNKVTVFSRLEGLQSTSLPSLTAHIQDVALPRLQPFLNRLKQQKRTREQQRELREEQDRAYAEAGRRDLERVRAKEAELKAKQDAEENERQVAALKANEANNRIAWRKLTASKLAGSEPKQNEANIMKLVIRLPDGKRLIRRFRKSDKAELIWNIVECEAHGVPVASAPSTSFETYSIDTKYQPTFAFSLATTFPRRVLKLQDVGPKTLQNLTDEGILDKSVDNLIVEGLTAGTSMGAQDDEEDEEEEED